MRVTRLHIGIGVDQNLPWATLVVCPRCAGPRRILGAATEPHAVRRLLAALGLAAEPPPAGLARVAGS